MTPEARRLAEEGVAALRRGDGPTARARFEAMASDTPWLLLAQACNATGDADAEEAALRQQLNGNIRDLPALLMMGKLKARAGDDRAANSWYQAALNQAGVTQQLPNGIQPLLTEASAFLQSVQGRYEAHLARTLEASGAASVPRVAQALELLLGKRELYLQQPTSFYFPGLPQRAFYERAEFAWLAGVEAAVPAMQAELTAIVAEDREFAPYVEGSPGRPAPNNPLRGDPSWGALYLWKSGAPVPENASRAPATMAALEAAPLPRIPGRSPMALYSLLKPGTHIQPHHGLLNTRLICHVPLIAPPGCALRVGAETREWRAGETLIFDDSFEHEAWNRSETTRIILLFEIWRPEIGPEERAALTSLFEAIDAYGGMPEDQG